MSAVYDRIGHGYTTTRVPDPRLAQAIRTALADARSVMNVGAGSGSYESGDLSFFAVDPSYEMIRQRPPATVWRRPEAYLSPAVRQAMSGLAQLPPGVVDAGLARLAQDLRSGRWSARWGALTTQESADLGYRLVVSPETSGRP